MSTAERGTRRAFVLVVTALVGLHACMAATRMAATLAVLAQGFPEWTVGALLSLYGMAPIVLSLWAGRMADRHGFHRPVTLSVIGALAGALLPVLTQHIAALAISDSRSPPIRRVTRTSRASAPTSKPVA